MAERISIKQESPWQMEYRCNLYVVSRFHYNTLAAKAAFFNQRGIIRNEQY